MPKFGSSIYPVSPYPVSQYPISRFSRYLSDQLILPSNQTSRYLVWNPFLTCIVGRHWLSLRCATTSQRPVSCHSVTLATHWPLHYADQHLTQLSTSHPMRCNRTASCPIRCNRMTSHLLRCNRMTSHLWRCNRTTSRLWRCNLTTSHLSSYNRTDRGTSMHSCSEVKQRWAPMSRLLRVDSEIDIAMWQCAPW